MKIPLYLVRLLVVNPSKNTLKMQHHLINILAISQAMYLMV
jgi:hypothetical protein